AVEELCRSVVVVPDAVDERLFLAGTGGKRPSGEPRDPAQPVRLVFAGSQARAEDLESLREILATLERTRPGRFELEVPRAPATYPELVADLRTKRAR